MDNVSAGIPLNIKIVNFYSFADVHTTTKVHLLNNNAATMAVCEWYCVSDRKTSALKHFYGIYVHS